MGGAPMGGAPMGGAPPPGAAGGQESAENKPPTKSEDTITNLMSLDDILILENNEKEVISRIIQKQEEKVEEVSK